MQVRDVSQQESMTNWEMLANHNWIYFDSPH